MAKRHTKPSTSASGNCGHLTLFDCGAKRRRLNLSHCPELAIEDDCADVGDPDCVSSAQAQQTDSDTETDQSPRIAIDADSVPINLVEEVPTSGTTGTLPLEPPNVPSTSQQQHCAHTPKPSDISSSPSDKPTQPNRLTTKFPSTIMGNKKRSFNPDWFRTYSWLEYSAERDAAFCFPCRHFSMGSGRAEIAITKDVLRTGSMPLAKMAFSHAMLVVTHILRQYRPGMTSL